MRIQFASVFVPVQEAVLRFCTEVLGLMKLADIPMGPIIAVLFEDGRGNPINLAQTLERE